MIRGKTIKKSINIVVFLIIFQILIPSSFAGELNVKPGQWLFTVLINNNLIKESKIEKLSRCIDKPQMSPIDDFGFNLNKSNCNVFGVKSKKGKSLIWRWFCSKIELKPKTNGSGVYISSGTEINGLLKTAHYSKKGNLVKTRVNIEGKHIGSCNSSDKLVINY